jgi:hypothetical protein
MDLEVEPFIGNIEFFLKPLDKALADVAERSDIV